MTGRLGEVRRTLLEGRAKLRSALRVRRLPVARTPWSWVDDGGLYYGDDGAWQYFSSPLSLLAADRDGLGDLMQGLVDQLGTRHVHLALYGWEEKPFVTDPVTDEHGAYLAESLRMLTPGHMLAIGVKLEADPEHRKQADGVRRTVLDVIDTALGEDVPDLDAYIADRYRVASLVAGHGLSPISGSAADMLEAWPTLGVPRDVVFTETDDAIVVRSPETLELVSVRSFSEAQVPPPATPVAAGEGGVTVVSVRGQLRMPTRQEGQAGDPCVELSGASVVLGRRAKRAPTTLIEACLPLAGAECKPLPMRQFPALEETLPCSAQAVDPHLFRVTSTKLRQIGFNEPLPAGDRSGAWVGLASPDFSHPVFWGVDDEAGRTVSVAGGAGSGRTFLAEHLAWQAVLRDQRVIVVRDGADTGAPFTAPDDLVTTSDAAGLLDPFRVLPTSLSAAAAFAVLSRCVPGLDVERRLVLESSLQRAAAAGITDLASALRLVPDAVATALVARYLRTRGGRLLTGAGPAARPVQVWDVDVLLGEVADPAERSALTDLLVLGAQAHAGRRGLVLADRVGSWAPGTLAAAGRDHLAAAGTLGALVAVADTSGVVDGSLPRHDLTVLLRDDPDATAEALPVMGYQATPDTLEWLAACGPQVADGLVVQPALGLLWDATGRGVAVSVGPVPLRRLPPLTRGSAHTYLADAALA